MMRPFADAGEVRLETYRDILDLRTDRTWIVWSVDRLAADLLCGLDPTTLGVLAEIGGVVLDAAAIWYRPGRWLRVQRVLGSRIAVRGTQRSVYGVAALWGRDPLREVLRREECEDLVELMKSAYQRTAAVGLALPAQWCGPGDLAAASMHRAGLRVPADPEDPGMSLAYYGGRIEITAHGDVPGPLYEYDIRSAYAAAMCSLPPPGGEWREGYAPDGEVLSFAHWMTPLPYRGRLGPLPARRHDQVIAYPYRSSGVYWERELRAAEMFGARVDRERSWSYIPPEPLWPAMISLMEDLHGARSSPDCGFLKPVAPACYGKFIQGTPRDLDDGTTVIIGKSAWRSVMYASIVTATVRAWILDAAGKAPDDIVMIATDSIWARKPLDLPLGAGMGQWKLTVHPDAHIVGPGLYWTAADRLRTAGWRPRDVEPRKDALRRLWRHRSGNEAPAMRVPIKLVGSLPLGWHMRDFSILGREMEVEMKLAYSWKGRRRHELDLSGGIWRSRPKASIAVNVGYRKLEKFDVRQALIDC